MTNVACFALGALAMAGGVALGAYITWRLMDRESPLPLPAKSKPFECFAHTDEDEVLLEEGK